jgi:hypothetical protein
MGTPLAAELAARITDRTEGWAAALQLAAVALLSGPRPQPVVLSSAADFDDLTLEMRAMAASLTPQALPATLMQAYVADSNDPPTILGARSRRWRSGGTRNRAKRVAFRNR